MKRALSFMVLALGAAYAGAAEYPTRPVRIISPFPPGGSVDLVARLVGADLASEIKKWRVVFKEQGIKAE